MGEEGIDTGGPSREFWRLFMHSVDKTYFVGNEGKQTLARNVPALEVNEVYVYVYIYIYIYIYVWSL